MLDGVRLLRTGVVVVEFVCFREYMRFAVMV